MDYMQAISDCLAVGSITVRKNDYDAVTPFEVGVATPRNEWPHWYNEYGATVAQAAARFAQWLADGRSRVGEQLFAAQPDADMEYRVRAEADRAQWYERNERMRQAFLGGNVVPDHLAAWAAEHAEHNNDKIGEMS